MNNKAIGLTIFVLILTLANVFHIFGKATLFFQYAIGFWYGIGFAYLFSDNDNRKTSSVILFGLLSEIIFIVYLFISSNNYDVFPLVRRFLASGICAVLFGYLVSKFYKQKVKSYQYFVLFALGFFSTLLLMPAKENSLLLNDNLLFGKYTIWVCMFLWQFLIGVYSIRVLKRYSFDMASE